MPSRYALPAVLLAWLGMSTPPSARAGTLADLARQIDQPRVGGTVEVEGPIPLGRAVLAPASPVRLLLAGEEPCGLLVTGAATLVYRVEDRFSVPVAERNFKRASSLRPSEKDGVLEVTVLLDGALLWGWELARGRTASPGEGQLPEWAAAVYRRPFFSLPHSLLIPARYGGAAGAVHALLHGSSSSLLLEIDPADERTETLSILDRVTTRQSELDGGRYYGRELAAQPINRQWWEHELAPLVAVHQNLRVDNDQGSHVTVTTATRLEAAGGPSRLWSAALVERTVTEGRRLLASDKELPVRVLAVEVDGKPADYLHQGGELLVALAQPLGQGQRAEVKVVHEGAMAVFYGGHYYWTLGTWPWYPTPRPNGQLATVNLELRVPAGLTPFASGTTTSTETKDGFTVLQSRLEKPAEWVVISAGKYHVFSDTKLGVTANAASYLNKDERGARRLINNLFAAIQCYQRFFDVPFPFAEVDILERVSWGYGQAPPGVIFITQEAFNPLLEGMDRLFSEGVNGRYLHEVAHSYWPHVAKLDSMEENWTSESFAEYTSAVCLDALAENNQSFRLKVSLARWRGDVRDLHAGASLYLANHLAADDPEDAQDRRRLLYAKGPLVLHALREELKKQAGEQQGEKQFWIFLRSYLKSFSFTWGGTPYMVAILDKITGQAWQPWFERYVYGTEMPPLKD